MFPPRPAGAPPINPEADRPIMLMYTTSITFDTSVNEFNTEDPINLSTDDTEIQGTGLLLVYNEVRDRVDKLELGSVDRGFVHAFTKKGADASGTKNARYRLIIITCPRDSMQ